MAMAKTFLDDKSSQQSASNSLRLFIINFFFLGLRLLIGFASRMDIFTPIGCIAQEKITN